MDTYDDIRVELSTFESLALEHYADMYRIALHIAGQPEDAEDIAQDAMLAAFRAWKGFRGEASAKTWLRRIAANAALKHVARGKAHPYRYLTPDDAERMPDEHGDPLRLVLQHELRVEVHDSLAELRARERIPLVLREYHDFTNAEIADVLGMREPAAKSQLHRARARFHAMMRDFANA